MTQFENKSLSVGQRGRSPSVCHERGQHGEPDTRGRCFMCGEKVGEPANVAKPDEER